MAEPVDLTLLALRLVQGPSKPPVREWFFLPSFTNASAEEARALLQTLPKPLVVTPAHDPGYVALWPVASLDPAARAKAEYYLSNQQAFFDAKIAALFPEGVDAVRLTEGEAEITLSLEAFRHWARDYFITSGSGLDRGPDSRVAQLFFRRPGGTQRPVGIPEQSGPPRAAS